jgi:mRNA-degrading endonuclease RelE of RelBE toxin-antitoxin system
MRKIDFQATPEFEKEIEKIAKKGCRSVFEDLNTFKKALRVNIPEHQSTMPISNLGDSVKIPVYKVRRFRCRKIKKGAYSGFRLIYAYIEDSATIIFVEFYNKNKKPVENRKRIYQYFTEK